MGLLANLIGVNRQLLEQVLYQVRQLERPDAPQRGQASPNEHEAPVDRDGVLLAG
jgi:hypothetical protein